ncbi:cytochrome c biogenesis CcdA family protein [Natronorarus salvus]|uniref:cytochrome c biogenesis CcdA family protein n=1 Tax=Natronorarus salvus TaxID=3117733 RepID=UPI002F2600E9
MTELYGTLVLAVGAGLATFFSPCAYALLPGYVGYYVATTGGRSPPLSGVLTRGVCAAAGVLAVFVALGLVATVIGAAIVPYLAVLELAVGAVLVVFGLLVLLDLGPRPRVSLPRRRSSVAGFGLFGALYALAAAGCVAPLFLAVVVRSLALPVGETAAVMGVYAGSFALCMLAATTVVATGHGLGAERVAGYVDRAIRLSGVVLVFAGIGQLWVATGL